MSKSPRALGLQGPRVRPRSPQMERRRPGRLPEAATLPLILAAKSSSSGHAKRSMEPKVHETISVSPGNWRGTRL